MWWIEGDGELDVVERSRVNGVGKGSLQDEGGDVNREIARKQKATCASCENKQFQIYVPDGRFIGINSLLERKFHRKYYLTSIRTNPLAC